jgi:iron-regulated transporter 1
VNSIALFLLSFSVTFFLVTMAELALQGIELPPSYERGKRDRNQADERLQRHQQVAPISEIEQPEAESESDCALDRVDNSDDEFAPLHSSTQVSDDGEERILILGYARSLLYISHFFAQFSEGAWQFALILFLAAVSDYQSLILVSTYGMTSFAAVCLWGTRVGHFVDTSNRLFAAQRFIWTENLSVLVASVLCYSLLTHVGPLPQEPGPEAPWWQNYFYGVPSDWFSLCLLLGIHVFGPLAQILDHGFLVAIERDWIVVMSEENNGQEVKQWLSSTNVSLKQIDLSCKVVAPAVAGLVVGAFGGNDEAEGTHRALRGAAVLVGVLNVVALVVEYICTSRIYHLIPSLSVKKNESGSDLKPRDEEDMEASQKDGPNGSRCRMCSLTSGLTIYLEQSTSWGGLGLAMLYANALTFGALMTAFLVWKGMPTETVGMWRGVSAAMGLVGTVVYHVSSKRLTVVQAGEWSIIYLFGCLSLCFASFFVDDYLLSMTMLIVGTCASRIGLWIFDISVTQLMQDSVPEGVRGIVGGTQEALNSFFQLLSFSLGLFFPRPHQFYIFAAAGYVSIGLAMILYTMGVYNRAQDVRIP